MAGLKELNKAVNGVLRSIYPNYKIYAGEVTEGFQRPSFFTQIIPMRMDYETQNYKSDRLVVAITYFNESDTELENIKMYDNLVHAFGRTLKVRDRHLRLLNIHPNNADGYMQFRFDLDFWSQLEKTEKYELMKELEVKIDKE